MASYLDKTGLTRFWNKVKTFLTSNYQAKLVSGTNIKTINNNSLLGSGNISVGGSSGPLVHYSDDIEDVMETAFTWNGSSGYYENQYVRIEINYNQTSNNFKIRLKGFYCVLHDWKMVITFSSDDGEYVYLCLLYNANQELVGGGSGLKCCINTDGNFGNTSYQSTDVSLSYTGSYALTDTLATFSTDYNEIRFNLVDSTSGLALLQGWEFESVDLWYINDGPIMGGQFQVDNL